MNWDQFKKNVGARYRFEPPAVFLDEGGNELPEEHDDWQLTSIVGHTAKLQNVRTGHVAQLAKDNIKEFGSDSERSRGGVKHGFLLLKVQVFIQGNKLSLRGTPGPGLPVARQRRIRPEWTPWKRVISNGFPPGITRSASIQYRLWCDDPAVPLMIRFASTESGGYRHEVSGPSGVIEQLIIESSTYYYSLSHPKAEAEISVTGFALNR